MTVERGQQRAGRAASLVRRGRSRSPRPVAATGCPTARRCTRRAITTGTALRLSRALGVDDRSWITLQTDYDLEVERDLHSDELATVTTLVAG
ncbi:MAG: helix-turn-helix transcriptional regulator [Dermatophilaceae bacterium]